MTVSICRFKCNPFSLCLHYSSEHETRIGEFKHYRHTLAAIQCNPPRIQCFFRECSECPQVNALHIKLEKYNIINQLHYKQWASTDRSNLETVHQTIPKFRSCTKLNWKSYYSTILLLNNKHHIFSM